ncbi:MAG: TonB-dependent receptor [Acidobacteria bacterium]|nr:TonB-dependent receptor [Acidobacteriota bacterium]
MKMLSRVAATLACLTLSAAGATAQTPTARVTGRVLDAINASPLPGVTVEVAGTTLTTYTDLDGKYSLDLPLGKHEIKVFLSGFVDRIVTIDLSTDKARTVDVTLGLAGFSAETTVVGQAIDAETTSAATQLFERRRASTINDNMGSQDIKANADSNAAAALQRVTGLSVVDNQYVFVRGLGERYSNTTLGGATLPSTEPERKVVALDMFPAGLLDNVSVVKTFTPDHSAEFAGGLVEINLSKLPSRATFDVSYTLGSNSLVRGKRVLGHPSGDRDWLGLKNSDRGLPSIFPNTRLIRGGIYTPEVGELASDLERYGEALPNLWTPTVADGKANQGFSISAGNRFGKLGVSASVNQSYRTSHTEEAQTYFSGTGTTLTPFSTYDYNSTAVQGALSGMANLAYQLNSNNRIALQGFSTNKGSRESRTFEGYNDDASHNLRNARLLWREEELRTASATGDHLFPTASNSRLDWRVTVSRSNRNEPDIRETLYEELTTGSGVYTLADESQSGLRMFNTLKENGLDLAANWSVAFNGVKGLPAMVKFGPGYTKRTRNFDSRRFRFVPLNLVRFDLTQTPEQLFSTDNIGTRFELREETRTTDSYDAEQQVTSGYGMLDISLSARARLVAGARVENFRQTVDTFDLFGTDLFGSQDIIRGEIKQTDIFPAANLVISATPSSNVRVGFSQTVNRPEFRELAPFEFTDIVGGRAVVGNPDLERSLIQNFDLRWEWFGSSEEVLSASLFFKRFDQPIVPIVEATAQLRTTFANADSARNTGVELEARKRLSDHFMVGGNYTFVDSQITLNMTQTSTLTNAERALVGTSRHNFNGILEARSSRLTARLLFNSFSDRISDLGSFGLPDIFEEGRRTLDLAVSGTISKLRIRLSVDNLTDTDVRFLQGANNVHRLFKLGRTFAVQFGASAF